MSALCTAEEVDELDVILGTHRVGPVRGSGVGTLRTIHADRGKGLETGFIWVAEENRRHRLLADGAWFCSRRSAGECGRVPTLRTAIRPPGKEREAFFASGTKFHGGLLKSCVSYACAIGDYT